MNDFSAEHAAEFSMLIERATQDRLKDEYLKKASALLESAERSLALRIGRHFFDDSTKAGCTKIGALALALEREDEQLNEWRQNLARIRAESQGESQQTNALLAAA